MNEKKHDMGVFERYLTLWVGLCIVLGILLGQFAPQLAKTLDGMSITVNGAPIVSVPIAICLFFMMYPIMVKIDFSEVVKAGKITAKHPVVKAAAKQVKVAAKKKVKAKMNKAVDAAVKSIDSV